MHNIDVGLLNRCIKYAFELNKVTDVIPYNYNYNKINNCCIDWVLENHPLKNNYKCFEPAYAGSYIAVETIQWDNFDRWFNNSFYLNYYKNFNNSTTKQYLYNYFNQNVDQRIYLMDLLEDFEDFNYSVVLLKDNTIIELLGDSIDDIYQLECNLQKQIRHFYNKLV